MEGVTTIADYIDALWCWHCRFFQAFWDQTGGIWFNQELSGKYAGIFVSTDTPGGGQEVTAMNFLSTLTHHGIIYVPLGYKGVSAELMNLSEVHGGE